jgi:hypothetical protein
MGRYGTGAFIFQIRKYKVVMQVLRSLASLHNLFVNSIENHGISLYPRDMRVDFENLPEYHFSLDSLPSIPHLRPLAGKRIRCNT